MGMENMTRQDKINIVRKLPKGNPERIRIKNEFKITEEDLRRR